MTAPDSVGKDERGCVRHECKRVRMEMQAELTRLQTLDRQRQEECEALRVKANTLGDGYLDASHRAQTAEAALAEAHRWLTELSDYIVNERDRQVLPRKAASYQRELDELTTFLTRIAKEPKSD